MEKPAPGTASLMEKFSTLVDPRIERTKKHSMTDLLVISICGFICGIDNWVELEEFGEIKKDWFKEFLELPNGIPSHDTFGRFYAALDPDEFSRCFTRWVQAIHMVSAWASKAGLVLGQVKTDAESNEIPAIPRLLEILRVEGCIVTIDASPRRAQPAEG